MPRMRTINITLAEEECQELERLLQRAKEAGAKYASRSSVARYALKVGLAMIRDMSEGLWPTSRSVHRRDFRAEDG